MEHKQHCLGKKIERDNQSPQDTAWMKNEWSSFFPTANMSRKDVCEGEGEGECEGDG